MNKKLYLRSEHGEDRNIVCHIYIDTGLYASYSVYPISWIRLLLFPALLLLELVFRFDGECHLRKHKIVTYFAGYIVQEGKLFRVLWHKRPIETCRTWCNLFRRGWKTFFPNYRKKPDHAWSCTEEGDGVEYIPVSEAMDKLGGLKEATMTHGQFLEFTLLTKEEFAYNEYIKYTGM